MKDKIIRKKRIPHDLKSILILDNWFIHNIDCPYPTNEDKALLANETGLSFSQVTNWFLNRRRKKKLKQYLYRNFYYLVYN